jgi:hypothetical protein
MRRVLVAGALVVATVAAMPMQAAMGARPLRDPIRGPVGFVGAAGEVRSSTIPANQNGCGVKLFVEVKGVSIDWLFSDGHEVSHVVATLTITNLVTGTSYVQTSDYHRSITAPSQ